MIKGTYKDVLKVFEDGNSYYKVVYAESEILSLYKELSNADVWVVKKISHPETTLMWHSMKNIDENMEMKAYSTGGGFYTAEVTYQGKIFTVENDTPLCMNIYNDTDNEEERFMPENMVDSYDVNTREMSSVTRSIYEYLIALLSEQKGIKMAQPGKHTNAYKNKLKYETEYTKTKCRQITLMLNRINDADIIEYLDTLENKNGYLKELIRKDMTK